MQALGSGGRRVDSSLDKGGKRGREEIAEEGRHFGSRKVIIDAALGRLEREEVKGCLSG